MANPGKNLDSEDIWSVERESCRRFDSIFKRLHSALNRFHFAIEIAFEYLLRFLRLSHVQFLLGVLTGLAVVAGAGYSIYLLIMNQWTLAWAAHPWSFIFRWLEIRRGVLTILIFIVGVTVIR